MACKQCLFYQPYSSESNSGKCRRYPPIIPDERQQIIEEINQLPIEDSKRISNRLRALMRNTEEECPEEELLSVPSMRDFEKFLKTNSKWIYPDIVVSPSGNIIVEWFQDNKYHLTIEFVGQGTSKIVMIAPDIIWKNKVSILSAKVSIESIAEAIDER